jgi:hypothetical protein
MKIWIMEPEDATFYTTSFSRNLLESWKVSSPASVVSAIPRQSFGRPKFSCYAVENPTTRTVIENEAPAVWSTNRGRRPSANRDTNFPDQPWCISSPQAKGHCELFFGFSNDTWGNCNN